MCIPDGPAALSLGKDLRIVMKSKLDGKSYRVYTLVCLPLYEGVRLEGDNGDVLKQVNS